jgi:hypothetical protein
MCSNNHNINHSDSSMNKLVRVRFITLLLVFSLVLAACSSTTTFNSIPSGAKLYLDGAYMGTTPYAYSDSKIVMSKTAVRMEMEGYDPFVGSITRDEEAHVGAIIGGIFLWVPFLWALQYRPDHTYILKPATGGTTDTAVVTPEPETPAVAPSMEGDKTKAERLRELKQLLDENLITQEDYNRQKQKILDE